MKFPYTPLDGIISEVESQFKTFSKQGRYDENDAYNYAIECVREIGMNNYDETTVGIRIVNHVGVLPQNFYLANTVHKAEEDVRCEAVTTILGAFKKTAQLPLRKTHVLYPGDSATIRLHHAPPYLASPGSADSLQTYSLKVPPGLIRTSFREGCITLQYMFLPSDDRGVICMQDEINAIKCVKAFVLLSMLKEDYVLGKVARYVYKDIEAEYDTYLSQAKGMQKLPDQAGEQAFAQMIQNRYNNFKLK